MATKQTMESIGEGYLKAVCTNIYNKYDYSKGEHDIDLVLKVINHNSYQVTYDIEEDSIQILDYADKGQY